jgi:hypothetical protein
MAWTPWGGLVAPLSRTLPPLSAATLLSASVCLSLRVGPFHSVLHSPLPLLVLLLGVLRFPLLTPVCLFPGLLISSFPPLLVPSVQISVPLPTPFLPISFSLAVTPYIRSLTPPPTARLALVPGILLAWVAMCPPPILAVSPCICRTCCPLVRSCSSTTRGRILSQ